MIAFRVGSCLVTKKSLFPRNQVLFNISHQVLHQLPSYANVRPFDTEAWDEPNKREQENLLTGVSFVASEFDV